MACRQLCVSPAEDTNTGSLCLKALSKWELYMGMAKNVSRASGSHCPAFLGQVWVIRGPALVVACFWNGFIWLLFTSCAAAALPPHIPACFPTLISHPEPFSVHVSCHFRVPVFDMQCPCTSGGTAHF